MENRFLLPGYTERLSKALVCTVASKKPYYVEQVPLRWYKEQTTFSSGLGRFYLKTKTEYL